MKKFTFIFALILSVCFLTSCHSVSPKAGEEAVLTYTPWFFGHGGVDHQAVPTGLTWCVFSTHATIFPIVPVKNQVDMNDLFSDDNTPLDFHTVIRTQIIQGKSPILLENYGENWFDANLYNYYCNLIRDQISQHSPFDLMSNREVLNEIDEKVKVSMQKYIAKLSEDKEFPVKIIAVTIGKATPNAEQLAEMNKTARAVQARQTQEREVEVQVAREKAERQRAMADKAYREELDLNTQDFINLKWIETIAAKEGANIDVMVGPATSMWNIRR